MQRNKFYLWVWKRSENNGGIRITLVGNAEKEIVSLGLENIGDIRILTQLFQTAIKATRRNFHRSALPVDQSCPLHDSGTYK
jgi:hypothetical protein